MADTHGVASKQNQAYGTESGESLEFPSIQGIFISLFSPKKSLGLAGDFSIDSVDAALIASLLDRLRIEITDSVEVKLLGAPPDISRVRGLFKDARYSVLTEKALIPGQKSTVLFYPRSHRVRLSMEPSVQKVKVLIVDDSATVRKLLTRILREDPTIEVIAETGRPSEVERLIEMSKPDVITLDIHMPEMDGVTLIKQYIARYPIPTVMISSISISEGPLVLEALEQGAVDYVQKPSMEELPTVAPIILEKVKAAAKAKVIKRSARSFTPSRETPKEALDQNKVIAIGASTGGTEALRVLLTQLPPNIPPILVVQHIPAVFSLAFARRLNDLCPFEVKEAEQGDLVIPGRVLIAPGGFQMRVVATGGQLKVVIEDTAPVNRHKPSVDVLFKSLAPALANRTIGVLLTGMGADGARGLLELKNAGARTIAQDEETCVVYGMPREAVKLGAVNESVPIQSIASLLTRWLSRSRSAA